MGSKSKQKARQRALGIAAAASPASYEIQVELSEKQIEADVAHYFGYVSASLGQLGHFRLLDIDEQLYGADKGFVDGAVAYYLQFKKPCVLRPVSAQEALTALPASASPKQHIRRFRRVEQLEQEPYSVCFQLHDKAKTATDFQHNILRRYESPPLTRAMYVCPLAFKHEDYVASMRSSWPDVYPFLYRGAQWIRDGAFAVHAASFIPYLRGHAAIVPHADVTSAAHYYSFSRHATDIAFHSPERLYPGPSRLSDVVVAEMVRYPEARRPLPELVAYLRDIASTWIAASGTPQPELEDPIAWLGWHGRTLHRLFGIRQVVALHLRGG